jgi:hypothetical protein
MVTRVRDLARRLLRRGRPAGKPAPAAPTGPPPPGSPLPPAPRHQQKPGYCGYGAGHNDKNVGFAGKEAARDGQGGTLTLRRAQDGRLHANGPDGIERDVELPAWSRLPRPLADQLAACRLARWARETGATGVKAGSGADEVGAAVTASLP